MPYCIFLSLPLIPQLLNCQSLSFPPVQCVHARAVSWARLHFLMTNDARLISLYWCSMSAFISEIHLPFISQAQGSFLFFALVSHHPMSTAVFMHSLKVKTMRMVFVLYIFVFLCRTLWCLFYAADINVLQVCKCVCVCVYVFTCVYMCVCIYFRVWACYVFVV